MPMLRSLSAVALMLAFSLTAIAQPPPGRNVLVPTGYIHYAPSPLPDRIILLPDEQPHQQQTVTWRTDASVDQSRAQIAVALDTPGLHLAATEFFGHSLEADKENGLARHHRVTFTDLEPDTLYAYRVAGNDTWSEWFQFRTPRDRFEPFSFLYFGDAQNSVKSHFSRVVREAWRQAPMSTVMLHAGDLINHAGSKHDDEWGEWFDAGGFLHSMVPAIVAAGNHEYLSPPPDRFALNELWKLHFEVPDNGIEELPHTTYFTHYQGVLFVVLDSTMGAGRDDSAQAQARWLEQVLENNPAQWVIIMHHHPVHSVSAGRDNPRLREFWEPVYRRYNVDLVLQGHDHTYGRGATNISEGATVFDDAGPVYVVSVAGPKMYLASDEARETHDRIGEDVQLYQIIHLHERLLTFESRTVTGNLYDAFSIERMPDGRKRFVESEEALLPERQCELAVDERRVPSRCWDGVELVY